MKVTNAKAPVKNRVAKSAIVSLIAVSIAASPVNTLVAEAREPETILQTDIKQDNSTARYQIPSFEETEMIDTKLCIPEQEVERITEKICSENSYKYVTPEILESIAFQESRFREDISNGTATGAYQIKPEFHPEELAAAGLTEAELKNNFENQTRFAAEVVEKYALYYAENGLKDDDILKAAVANYHLCQKTADKMIESKNWDDYTIAVIDRKDKIEFQKSLDDREKLTASSGNSLFDHNFYQDIEEDYGHMV